MERRGTIRVDVLRRRRRRRMKCSHP